MFYERKHSLCADTLRVEEGRNFSFPAHIHDSFELIAVTRGAMRIGAGSRQYEVKAGQAVLVFPEQVHFLEPEGECAHVLWIFSPEYVRAFSDCAFSHIPQSGLFNPTGALLERLLSLKTDRRMLHIKSVLYSLIDEFDANAAYEKRDPAKESLLLRIFDFVAGHYAQPCTLEDLCEATSYHYAYLSRFFSERTGIPFTQYVNSCRVVESCTRLAETSDSVTSIALDCGFDSLRSYHRNFRKYMGCTPTAYRRSHTYSA